MVNRWFTQFKTRGTAGLTRAVDQRELTLERLSTTLGQLFFKWPWTSSSTLTTFWLCTKSCKYKKDSRIKALEVILRKAQLVRRITRGLDLCTRLRIRRSSSHTRPGRGIIVKKLKSPSWPLFSHCPWAMILLAQMKAAGMVVSSLSNLNLRELFLSTRDRYQKNQK